MKTLMERSRSLDVFRGLTVALMILVNNPGSWGHVYTPLDHAPWNGLTPTDWVFPFFLFAVGNALAIVMPRLTLQKILKRTLIVFLIGFLMNGYPWMYWIHDTLAFRGWTWMGVHGLDGWRVMGVLQRIALAYGAAGMLAYFFPRKALPISAVLLVGYWALAHALGTSGDPYSLEGFFGTHLDRFVFTPVHIYHGEGVPFDPEGLASTIPAIAQVLLGYWIGKQLILVGAREFPKKAIPALLLCLGLGLLWALDFPINKKIWTSSYVLVTTGLATCFLTSLVMFLDRPTAIRSAGIWKFFEAFGKNPLFIFVLSGVIPRTMRLIRIPDAGASSGFMNPLEWFYAHFCAYFPGDPRNGSLVYAVILVGLYGWLAIFMDRKRIYIRV